MVERETAIHKLGFGASGAWAQPWFSRKKAIYLIHQALEGGVRIFDTAGFYANGEAESRLGEALRGRDDVFISVKTGTRNVGNFPFNRRRTKDFSVTAIREDLQASLKRLKRDQVDILYLHGPDYWVVSHTQPEFKKLKEQGLIAKSGICGAGEALALSVENQKTDAIMGVFNLFDQTHHNIFKAAKDVNIQTTAIAPLAQGFYRPGFFWPKSLNDIWAIARYLRGPSPGHPRRAEKPRPLDRFEKACKSHGYSMAQIMLAFVTSQNFVDVAMTTSTKEYHLHASMNVINRLPETKLIDELIKNYNDTLFG